MKKPFIITEHTADVGLEARGANLSQAFENLARGMFCILTDLEKIKPSDCVDIELESDDAENLAVEWLSELLYLNQTKGLLFNTFDIKHIDGQKIKARCCGEKYSEARHSGKTEIKAVTYYNLEVARNKETVVKVVFDI